MNYSILRALRNGHRVLVLLPEGSDPSRLRSDLRDDLEHWHPHVKDIPIADLDAQTPDQAMAPNTSGTILFLTDFNEELVEESRIQMLRSMDRWAQRCRSEDYADISPPALCLLRERSEKKSGVY